MYDDDRPADPAVAPWEPRGAAVDDGLHVGPDKIAFKVAADAPGLQGRLAAARQRLAAHKERALAEVRALPEFAAYERERAKAAKAQAALRDAEAALEDARQACDRALSRDRVDRAELVEANRAVVQAEAEARAAGQLAAEVRRRAGAAQKKLRAASAHAIAQALVRVRDEIVAEALAVEAEALSRLGREFLDRASAALLLKQYYDHLGGHAALSTGVHESLFGREVDFREAGLDDL